LPIKLPDGTTHFWLSDKGKFAGPEDLKALGLDPTEQKARGPLEAGASMLSFIDDPKLRQRTEARMMSLYEALGSNATPEKVEAIVKAGEQYAKSEEDKAQQLTWRREDKQTAVENAREAAAQRERDKREDKAEDRTAKMNDKMEFARFMFQLNATKM